MSSELIILLVAAAPVFYLSTFVHEAGHAIMGSLCGFGVTAFGLGLGRVVWVVPWGGTRIYFGLRTPFQGITWVAYQQIFPSRRALAGLFVGGVLANFLFALGAGLLGWLLPWGARFWYAIAGVNLFYCVTNLIPFSFQVGKATLRSDGAVVLQSLWHGSPSTPAPIILQNVKAFRSLWVEIGDTRIHRSWLLTAAMTWLDLGVLEQAESCCAQADALPPDDRPFSLAYRAVVGGFVAHAAGQGEASAACFAEAETRFAAIEHQAGLFLVAIGRCQTALLQGNLTTAAAKLAQLRTQPWVMDRTVLRQYLFELNLALQVAADAQAEVESLRVEYEACRRANAASHGRDLHVYRTLAAYYSRHEDCPRAESAYRFALNAVRQIHAAFADKEDQVHFLTAQAPLRAEVGRCLRQLGKEDEVAKLDKYFAEPANAAADTVAVKQERNRRHQRAGILLTLINFVVGAGAVAATMNILQPQTSRPHFILLVLGFLLLLYAVVAGLYSALMYPIWWLRPTSRQSGGVVTLIFAIAPWLTWIVVTVLLLCLDDPG